MLDLFCSGEKANTCADTIVSVKEMQSFGKPGWTGRLTGISNLLTKAKAGKYMIRMEQSDRCLEIQITVLQSSSNTGEVTTMDGMAGRRLSYEECFGDKKWPQTWGEEEEEGGTNGVQLTTEKVIPLSRTERWVEHLPLWNQSRVKR